VDRDRTAALYARPVGTDTQRTGSDLVAIVATAVGGRFRKH